MIELALEEIKQNIWFLNYISDNLKKEFIKDNPNLIKYIELTPELHASLIINLVKIVVDSGLKDKNLLIKNNEEENRNLKKISNKIQNLRIF